MYIKKKTLIAVLASSCLVFSATGAFAATGIENIKAYLNHNLSFTLNGKAWAPKDGNGKALAPIVYNGSTYLPAKAIGDAVDAQVVYDAASQKINITTSEGSDSNAGIPYNDAPTPPTTTTPPDQPSTPPAKPPVQSSGSFSTITLPKTFDKNKVNAQILKDSLVFYKYIAAALRSDDYSGFNSFVDKAIPLEEQDYSSKYYHSEGKKKNREDFKEVIQSVKEQLSHDSIIKIADNLDKLTVADLESADPFVFDITAIFESKTFLEETSRGINVTFDYSPLDDGTYYLTRVTVSIN